VRPPARSLPLEQNDQLTAFKFLSVYPSTVKFLSVLRRWARLSEPVRVVIRFVVVLMRQHVEQPRPRLAHADSAGIVSVVTGFMARFS